MSNDLLLMLDTCESAILVLVHLSAAFDTVDHPTLQACLHQWVGFRVSALQWFSSYLIHSSFSVSMGQHSSSSAPLSCGVPQGSILGPILFCLYMLPLWNTITKYNLRSSFHSMPMTHNYISHWDPETPFRLSQSVSMRLMIISSSLTTTKQKWSSLAPPKPKTPSLLTYVI